MVVALVSGVRAAGTQMGEEDEVEAREGAQPVTPRWGCGYSVSPPAMTTLLIDTSNLLWAVSTAWML